MCNVYINRAILAEMMTDRIAPTVFESVSFQTFGPAELSVTLDHARRNLHDEQQNCISGYLPADGWARSGEQIDLQVRSWVDQVIVPILVKKIRKDRRTKGAS